MPRAYINIITVLKVIGNLRTPLWDESVLKTMSLIGLYKPDIGLEVLLLSSQARTASVLQDLRTFVAEAGCKNFASPQLFCKLGIPETGQGNVLRRVQIRS